MAQRHNARGNGPSPQHWTAALFVTDFDNSNMPRRFPPPRRGDRRVFHHPRPQWTGTRLRLFRGRAAKLPFLVHPHMLRHSTGIKLANDGHDTRSLAHYLSHRDLQSTARYTALAPDRFARFWQD
jgi:integrase